MSDTLLGATLGCLAGLVLNRVYPRAFKLGWTVLGPYRAAEGGSAAINQVALRTLGRALLGFMAGGASVTAVVLGFSLPAAPLVDAWTRFIYAWAVAFVAGFLSARIIEKRLQRTQA